MKKVSKWIWAVLLVVPILCSCSHFVEKVDCSKGNGIGEHGHLYVEDTQLVDEHGELVMLRGMSSHGITWFPRYLNGGAMKSLREEGANLFRLAMYTDPPGAYVEEPQKSKDYLYMGIESALAQDMYVIVDWHILKDGDPNQYMDEAESFFGEISSHYGNNPGILYEICNEPNGETTWEDISKYANRIIPVIRTNAPDAIILVGVPSYCTDFRGPLEKPLKFGNIMYSMHRYIDVSEKKDCGAGQLEKILGQGLPIFVTEWGIAAGEDTPFEDEEKPDLEQYYVENARPFVELMETYGVSWAAWALSSKDEVHSILRADCDKLSGWTRDDLTQFGKLIFDNFR